MAEFRGTPVVLNFFASWCVSCDRELPLFRQAVDDFGDDVQILFINSNETGNWRPMAERNGIDDQILIDDTGGSNNIGLYRSLGGTGGMLLTAFYDTDGTWSTCSRENSTPTGSIPASSRCSSRAELLRADGHEYRHGCTSVMNLARASTR